MERSIGKKSTEELAVMIDPFKPFQLTEEAVGIEQKDYFKSWLPNELNTIKK
jgi:homogentisate 1,2-dioxygenase